MRGREGEELAGMVTIKAGPLTELVGDIFAKAGCSAAGRRAHRQIPGLRQPDRPRQPRRRARAALSAVEARRRRARRPQGQGGQRDAGSGGGRRVARLRPDRDAAGRRHRHRQVQGHGPLHGGAEERRPHRPGRRLGRDGGRGRPRLGAFRQCLGQRAGGARSAAPSAGSPPRRSASACRGPASRRWCSTSPPRSSPRARCWWRARAARSCPTTR